MAFETNRFCWHGCISTEYQGRQGFLHRGHWLGGRNRPNGQLGCDVLPSERAKIRSPNGSGDGWRSQPLEQLSSGR